MNLRGLCRRVAGFSPIRVPPSSALANAMRTLDDDLDAATLATAITVIAVFASFVAFMVSILGVGTAALAGSNGSPLSSGILIMWLLVACSIGAAYSLPLFLAMRRRASWAGALPGFVCRVALGMRLTPTLEEGVRVGFATDDPLTRRVPQRTGLPADAVLATALSGLGPAAQRVNGLLSAATTAADPDTLLDRAVETALDDTREQVRTYAASLQGPVTAIYAFGVVLPLALVGILPAAPLVGYDLPLLGLAVVLDVLLPLCLIAAAGWLIAQRPMVDPPAQLPPSHPDRSAWVTVATAGILGIIGGIAIARFFPSWTIWMTPAAWGVGAALLARYQSALPAVESLQTTRAALPDLLTLLGDAMADGLPPERALAEAGDLPGTAGTIASDASRTQRHLGVSMPAALGGEYGPLADLDDRQSDALTALVSSAAMAGRPGGRALSRYADHLDALAELDRAMRADLARITGTLGQTAAVYAPAIGGVTVALASRLQDSTNSFATTGDGFALAVGGYVLVLALVLPALATALQDGISRVRIGANVGRALLLAGGLFPLVAHLATSLL